MSLKPIDYYDATKWDTIESRPLLQREEKAISQIKVHIGNKKASVLDVGCGDGFFLDELHKQLDNPSKVDLHGVDYSKYKLKLAAKRPYKFKWCNLEVGIPHPDKTFDVVYSGEVIEHIYNPDYMLEECFRVLKKNGLLIVSTPNLQAWYNRILFTFGIQPLFYETSTKSTRIGAGAIAGLKKGHDPVGHLRVFNRTALRDIVEQEGFEVLDVKGATFQTLPKAVHPIDNFFNIRPSLASNLIIVARKK